MSLIISFATVLIVTISVCESVELTLARAHVVSQGLSVHIKSLVLSLGCGTVSVWYADYSYQFYSAAVKNRQQSHYVVPDGWSVGFHRLPYGSESWPATFVLPGVRYVTYAYGARGSPTDKGPSTWLQRRRVTVSGGWLILLVAVPWFRYQASKKGKTKEVGSS